MIGIVGYAGYVPRLRITREDYIKALGTFSARDVQEKAITSYDEDVITMAVNAASDALKRGGVSPDEISGVFFASSTHPYIEKSSSSTVAAALTLSSDVQTSDFGFTTKAGVDALLACIDFISSNRGVYGLVVVSDSPKANLGDKIEHGFGAGASAFLIGKEDIIAYFEDAHSSTEEILGERFRRNGDKYIQDINIVPYTQSAFQRLVKESVLGLMMKLRKKSDEVNYIIMHQSDIREALRMAKECGFSDSQVSPCLVTTIIGDAGASSTLLGLVKILDQADVGDRVLINSYGSGSGSNTLSFKMGQQILEKRERAPLLVHYISDKEYIDYLTYIKLKGMM